MHAQPTLPSREGHSRDTGSGADRRRLAEAGPGAPRCRRGALSRGRLRGSPGLLPTGGEEVGSKLQRSSHPVSRRNQRAKAPPQHWTAVPFRHPKRPRHGGAQTKRGRRQADFLRRLALNTASRGGAILCRAISPSDVAALGPWSPPRMNVFGSVAAARQAADDLLEPLPLGRRPDLGVRMAKRAHDGRDLHRRIDVRRLEDVQIAPLPDQRTPYLSGCGSSKRMPDFSSTITIV
jgi:hypothetical protein